MLGYNDLLSRPSIEMNAIWEPINKKLHKKKKKKKIHNSSNPCKVRTLSL